MTAAPQQSGFGAAVAMTLLASGVAYAEDGLFEATCVGMSSSHSIESDWRDLGNGFVSYADTSFSRGVGIISPVTGQPAGRTPSWSATTLFVEECASGRKLSVPVYECEAVGECVGSAVSVDIQDEAVALLDEATSPDTVMTFEMLGERFKAISNKAAFEEADDHESCACQVSYPQLRSGKSRWEPQL